MSHCKLLGLLAAGMMFTSALAYAQAPIVQVVGNAHVRVPSGELLIIPDNPGTPWYRDERVTTYQRFYYNPQENIYVVYNDNDDYQRHWPHHEDRWCPPGHAKHGRC